MLNTSATARTRAIETAKQIVARRPVYLDTETTGLDNSSEIIEISIVDDDGKVLFESLVRPSQPIPAASTRIHGLRDEDVRTARPWPILWPEIRNVLFNRLIVMYNESFDKRMIEQTHKRYNMRVTDRLQTFDLLALYAQFRGEWDSYRRSYRFHSLADAGRQCQISLPNAHRSTADTLLTRALLHYIADCPA